MNFIYYKEFLMLLKIYMAAFVLFILQEFNNTQKKLIGQELIFILLGIKLLFGKDLSIIIYFQIFFIIILGKERKIMLEKYMPALETEEHDLNVGRDLLGDVKGTGKKKEKKRKCQQKSRIIEKIWWKSPRLKVKGMDLFL